MAPREQLEELHRLLADDIEARLRGQHRSSVELLQVARKFLKDQGPPSPPDAEGRKTLERLQRLYRERLAQAMDSGPANASLLAEARKALEWAGCSAGLPADAPGTAAPDLLALGLPFTKQ